MRKGLCRTVQRLAAAVLCMAALTISPAASSEAGAERLIYKLEQKDWDTNLEEMVPLTPEEEALCQAQLDQLVEACRDPIERLNPKKEEFYIPTKEERQELEDCAAALGTSVDCGDEMKNPGNILAFLEAVERGEDAHVFYANISTYDIGYFAFWFQDGSLFRSAGSVKYDAPTNYNLTNKMPLVTMKLSEGAHLLYAQAVFSPNLEPEERNTKEDMIEQYHRVLCVHENEPKAAAYLNQYIEPLSLNPRGCTLTTNWDPDHLDRLNWEALFADAYYLETQKSMWKSYPFRRTIIWKAENWPDGADDRKLIVPSEDVETLLEKYYPVTQEQLRKSKFYDPERDAYIFVKPTGYGTPVSYQPEIAAYQENEDGTLTLTVNCIFQFSKESSDVIEFTSKITIQPHEDGSYRYLSNRTDIVSQYSRDW